jgi:tRNA threonylcarbamoyladenosine biosynthesis protein TsaB
MNILAIETSCGKASVAIYSNKKIIAFCHDDAVNMQAENLFSLIDEAFEMTGLTYEDIHYLSSTTGPGSFTGIRIGLSAVKGICLAAPKLIPIAFSNFEVMAFRGLRQISNQLKSIIVILEASTTSLYVQTFDLALNVKHEPQTIGTSDINYYLTDFETPYAIIGNGIKPVIDKIEQKEGLIILPRSTEVNSKHLISLAAYKLRLGKQVSSNIEPLYIKPPSVNGK